MREEGGCRLSGDGSSSDYFAEGWVAEHSNADFIFVERTVAGASAGFSSTWQEHLCTLLTLAFGIVERCPHVYIHDCQRRLLILSCVSESFARRVSLRIKIRVQIEGP